MTIRHKDLGLFEKYLHCKKKNASVEHLWILSQQKEKANRNPNHFRIRKRGSGCSFESHCAHQTVTFFPVSTHSDRHLTPLYVRLHPMTERRKQAKTPPPRQRQIMSTHSLRLQLPRCDFHHCGPYFYSSRVSNFTVMEPGSPGGKLSFLLLLSQKNTPWGAHLPANPRTPGVSKRKGGQRQVPHADEDAP